MNNRLLVYDASAGSGKTHNLSGKFADYLLEEYNRGYIKDAYRYIMAVTFTNKATNEMKDRIIERLYKRGKGISKHDRELTEEEKAHSMEILKYLVHDYTMFKVSTIDSFFQRVIKAFAVERGSRSSYETTLDNDSAIAAAMDSLYSKLDTDDNLRSALENLSLARLEEEKNWNWRDDLLDICKRVLDSEYQNFKSASENSKSTGDVEKIINDKLEELNKKFVNPVIDIYETIKRESSTLNLGCLNGNKDLKKFLIGKLANTKEFIDKRTKTVLRDYPSILDDWQKNPDLYNKNCSDDDIEEIDKKVGSFINDFIDLFKDSYPAYKSLMLIKRYIKESAFLDYVDKELEEYLQKEQLILLSHAPNILADLIDGSSAPFVYEKIGSFIDHYLLDEFQDTSVVQWNNFKPLLTESLSQNKNNLEEGLESMLVGDVKQSIYRFRDGKWELFKDEVKKDFDKNYHKEPLTDNHRSLQNIVRFNNFLFSSVVEDKWFKDEKNTFPGALVSGFMANLNNNMEKGGKRSETIAEIYKKSAQHVDSDSLEAAQKGHFGVVHVISCAFDDKESKTKKDDFILWDLVRRINRLSDELGYKYKDIAILTNKNTEAGLVANYLVNNGISIVSGESLKLGSNKVVCLLIEILRKLVNAKDKGLEAFIRLSGKKLENLQCLDFESKSGKEFKDSIKSGNSLYQVCKLILRTFFGNGKLEDGDLAFVKAFLDRALDYSSTNGTSISGFVKWWDLHKDKLFIPEPSNSDAVQIMTMHKAKGLGFKVVFVPFLRDEMIEIHNFPSPEKVWVSSNDEKIGYSGPLLLPFSKDMEDSLYKDFYYDELMQRSVDNLNLAYVTFTRAKERLYIYAPKSGDSITTVSAALNKYIPSLSEFKANPEMLASGETIIDYVMGGDGETIYDTKDHADTIFEGGVESSKIMVEPQKISLRGSDEDDNIRLGVLYHELFSYIDGRGNTEGLIEEKVAKAVLKFLKKNPGTLLGDNFQTLEKDVLGKIFRVKEYGWFDEGKMVKNETSILSEKGMYRPDRVLLPADGSMDWAQVVDYKFGKFIEDSEENAEKVGYTHSDNVKQVGNYMKLLREMGYSDVKGWLWYVLEDKVEEVKGD